MRKTKSNLLSYW